MNSDIQALESRKKELEQEYRKTSTEVRDLKQKYENIESFLNIQKGDKKEASNRNSGSVR